MNRKSLFLSVIPIIILTLVTNGCGRKTNAVTSTPEIPVKITTVQKGNLGEVFVTTGALEANQEVSITPKVSGRVAKIYVKMGDHVSANQVLVELEQDDYEIGLISAEAAYKLSKENFERSKKLFAEKIISPQEFEGAQTDFRIKESGYKQAKNQLENTKIRAPFSGQIGFSNATLGGMVSPGTPLLSVVDLSTVFVTVNLSDSYISQAKIGQTAQITLSSFPDQTFNGRVAQIAPSADKVSKTFPVKIALDNSSHRFKAGMLAGAKLSFNQRNDILKIPAEAIVDEVGTKAVYVVEKDTARRRIVTPGISDGKMIEITSGLAEKEFIVILGQNNIEEGSKVVVK
ncbi:MAG: efflux RND transporter periplasmic adaptor subunit [Firmicutes bacterium]|nr:efflux RND transporter periplasmic adaptor subunit [Bacillota bacterium]